jgi:hypothetical protein
MVIALKLLISRCAALMSNPPAISPGVKDMISKPLVRRDIAEPLAQSLHKSAGKQSRVEVHPSRDASPLRAE